MTWVPCVVYATYMERALEVALNLVDPVCAVCMCRVYTACVCNVCGGGMQVAKQEHMQVGGGIQVDRRYAGMYMRYTGMYEVCRYV